MSDLMIKVCGITRRQDAEAAVQAGADALGFVFYSKSPRAVTAQQAAELGDGLDIWKVGVFVDETPASVETVMRTARLDVAQIYGGDAPAQTRVWRAIRMIPGSGALDPGGAEAVLLDGPGNGTPFDWSRARDVSSKVILAGGLDASNVAAAIQAVRPWGVDASSRLESSPGIKDPSKIRDFIRAARQAS